MGTWCASQANYWESLRTVSTKKNKAIAAAQKYVQKGLLDRAIKEYQSVVDEDPDDVRTWLKIGDLYSRKGAISEAVSTFNRVAEVYEAKGFFLKAVAVYKQILDVDPTLINMHRRLGKVYVKLNLLPEAIGQFQLVVGSLERDNRHEESIALLREMVELVPGDHANQLRLAEAYARDCKNEAAISAFRLVLTELRDRAKHAEFIKIAERLLYLYPEENDIAQQLAEAYLARRIPRRALTWLQMLFKADPLNTVTLYLLGQTFVQIDKPDRAVSVYRELARICAENGDRKTYLRAAQSILEVYPDDAAAQSIVDSLATGGPPAAPAEGGARTQAASESAMSIQDRVELCLSDAQLLMKYDLASYARDRLKLAHTLDSANMDVLDSLKALAVASSDVTEGVNLLLSIGRSAEKFDHGRAKDYLGAAMRMDPDNPAIQAELKRLDAAPPPDKGSQPQQSVPLAKLQLKSVPSRTEAMPEPEADEGDWLNESVDLNELNLDEIDLDLDDISLDSLDEVNDASVDGSFELSLDGFEPNEELGFEIDLDALEVAPDDDAFSDLLADGLPGHSADVSEVDEFEHLLSEEFDEPITDTNDSGHVVIGPPPTEDDFEKISFEDGAEAEAFDLTQESIIPDLSELEGKDLIDSAALDAMRELTMDEDFGGLLVDNQEAQPQADASSETVVDPSDKDNK
ncbi:MAG: tetratricopeptide repeat protein [Myxococcota bacterium]|nr:tetratricopeptide repeat protein [Myxococcota bacterium]